MIFTGHIGPGLSVDRGAVGVMQVNGKRVKVNFGQIWLRFNHDGPFDELAFAGNEILPDPFANRRPFNHRQFAGHVEGDMECFSRHQTCASLVWNLIHRLETQVVNTLGEVVLTDAAMNPGCKFLPRLEETMHFS